MSTILENLRKFDIEKAGSDLQFSNAGATSDISKKFIEKFKESQAGAGGDSILKEMRAKNMARAGRHIDFDNSLAQSDISKQYIEKYKATQKMDDLGGNSSSLLEALRKKNMDDTTGRM